MEAVAAARPRGRRWTNVFERQGVLASALIAPAVIFVLALVGGPLGLAIWLSFTNATTGLHGKWVGLQNFRHEWGNPAFQHAVWHTFLFTVISQAIVLVGAGLIAHALLKDFRGKWILRFLILLPWAAPIALSLMAWKWMFDSSYSILNWTLVHAHLYKPLDVPQYLAEPKLATGAVIAVHTWRILPFAVVTSTFMTLRRLHPGSRATWLAMAVGGAAAAFIASARVLGGMHFISDSVGGSVVGVSLGVLIPSLHRSPVAVVPLAADAGQRGLALAFRF